MSSRIRLAIPITLIVVVTVLLSACSPATTEPQAAATTEPQAAATTEPQAAATLAPAPATPAEFVGAWPYQPPPIGHLNSFVTGYLDLGIYQDLMEQPLAMYYWASGEWLPLLATEWELTPPDLFTITLRPGVVWSDGSSFSSEDVVTTFEIGRMMNWVVWRFVDRVEAVDDHTVNFHMSEPSTVVPYYVLRERIRPASIYGDFANRAKELDVDSDAMGALRQELVGFRPEEPVVTGPFKLDLASVTESQLTLNKNPTAWDADKTGFDRIVLYNGETPTITPIVLTNGLDYATHGFPPATEQQLLELGIRIVRAPVFNGPGLFLRNDIYPLNLKEVRQAIAYAVDRDENATVSLGESAVSQKYMTGVSDNIISLWLTDSDKAQLNQYSYDPQKAEELLLGLGFNRDGDGVWIDDQGTRMEYEVIVPAEFGPWSTAAENMSEQLSRFGIRTTVRGVTFTAIDAEVNEGKFEMAVLTWGAGNPHPHFSWVEDLFTHNYVTAAEGKGINFPMVQTTDALGEIDLEEAVTGSAKGLDENAQKALIGRMAIAFNELLPIIPLWERYGNNPILEDIRVTGWPADDDPIYKNSPYSDSFVILMILDGTLQPVR